jgi:branched-chain amino acid transport system permease protein
LDILITGILLGGTYALIAMGLNLQYGVARIMNLANGEILVAGGYFAFIAFTATQLSPILTIFLVAPLAFVLNWLIYRLMLQPLVNRAKNRGQLETDSILATFGLSFVGVGVMLSLFGGDYFSYSFMAVPVELLGNTYGANRVLSFVMAFLICGALYFWLNHSRAGLSIRAIATAPASARLVGIDVKKLSALAFALGGAVRGTIVAALLLGVLETVVASLIDPGLTLAAAYVMFLGILLFRPQGLFGKQTT